MCSEEECDRDLCHVCQSISFQHWSRSGDLGAVLWIFHLWELTLLWPCPSDWYSLPFHWSSIQPSRPQKSLQPITLQSWSPESQMCFAEVRGYQGGFEPQKTLFLSTWEDETTQKLKIKEVARKNTDVIFFTVNSLLQFENHLMKLYFYPQNHKQTFDK